MNQQASCAWVGPPWLLGPALALWMGTRVPERMAPCRGRAGERGCLRAADDVQGEHLQAGGDLSAGDFSEWLSLAVEGSPYVSLPPWWGSWEQRPGVLPGTGVRTAQRRRAGLPPRGAPGLPWDEVCSWGAQPACPSPDPAAGCRLPLWAPPPLTVGKSGHLQLFAGSGGASKTRTDGRASQGWGGSGLISRF